MPRAMRRHACLIFEAASAARPPFLGRRLFREGACRSMRGHYLQKKEVKQLPPRPEEQVDGREHISKRRRARRGPIMMHAAAAAFRQQRRSRATSPTLKTCAHARHAVEDISLCAAGGAPTFFASASCLQGPRRQQAERLSDADIFRRATRESFGWSMPIKMSRRCQSAHTL